MTTGLFLSATALNSFPRDVRALIIQTALGDPLMTTDVVISDDSVVGPEAAVPNPEMIDEHFAEMSPGQAREFISGCREKTRAAIEAVARGESRFLQVADIAKAVGVSAPELRGVWSGLTRRTRTITKDPEAYLFFWSGEPVVDAEGNYIDQQGQIQEMTYRSLRKALSL